MLSRTAAYFKKRRCGNDQQWPKNLTQVTESSWQVDAVKKVHIFVDPQGEKIEAMEEIKWIFIGEVDARWSGGGIIYQFKK